MEWLAHSLLSIPKVAAWSSRSRGGLAVHRKAKALAHARPGPLTGLSSSVSSVSLCCSCWDWTLSNLLDMKRNCTPAFREVKP